MQVKLKLGEIVVVVKNICLQDGYRPTVDGSPCTSGTSVNFHIESALWYKTLLLESVYINCDERQVHWVRKEHTAVKTIDDEIESQKRFVPVGAEMLHGDIDVYDFDPTVDELADKANDCMSQYRDRKITWEIFLTEVTRLLHCYIFPAIRFTVDDRDMLQDVLMLVESKFEMVEAEILKKSKSVDITEQTLLKQRTRILKNENFESELYTRSCKKEFLSLLHSHLERDIMRLNSEFEGTQLQVNRYRDCQVSAGAKLKLEDLRKKRDDVHEQIVTLQTAKETLRNVLFRPPVMKKKKLKKIKVKENVFHDIYLEVNDRLRLQKEDLQRVCLVKVKISSVREAILSALSELNASNDQLSPVHITDGSEFSLDIIGLKDKPEEWKTLEEKVYSLLQNQKSHVFCRHHQAVKIIMDKITSAIDETKMFGASSENIEGLWQFVSFNKASISDIDVRFVETTGGSSQRRRHRHAKSTLYSPDLVDEILPMAVDALKKSLERIKDDIRSQMEAMCCLLINSIPECAGSPKNKVWVSYENVLYTELLPHLCNLYELTSAPKCISLYRGITRLSLQDLLLDDNIVNVILSGLKSGAAAVYRRSRSVTSGSESSEEFEILSRRSLSKSCVSIEIKKCTLEELYQMADRECHQLSGSIPNLFDETNCGPAPDSDVSPQRSSATDSDDLADSEADAEEENVAEEVEDPQTLLEDMFSPVKQLLQSSFRAKTMLEKLRRLTRVFRSLGTLLSDLNKNGPMACCDEMLSIIIVLLRCLDEETFVRLYASVLLLIDLRAPFLNGSVHDCSLTNFYGAFDYLFMSQLSKKPVLDSPAESNGSFGSR
ncbi:uncharacterized protein [Haliotis asinina]|uniref:uncharacterized protein n=1 Tax=Haliotis asinina TaxID=109174 RepID=UPI003531F56C